MTTRAAPMLLLAAALPLAGCVGSDQTVFFTTDNVGINIGMSPVPVAEVAFSRREGVIEPVFENGRLQTVAASLRHDIKGLFPLGQSTGAVFAGGQAAVNVTQEPGKPTKVRDAHCVSKAPVGWDNRPLPEAGQSRPMIFTTDTTFGFKVSYNNGTSTPPLPDVHLGYKRNEVAVAPIMGQPDSPDCVQQPTGPKLAGTYGIHSPSFLAVAHNRTDTGETPTTRNALSIGQVFATGVAADQIAALPQVAAAFRATAIEDTKAAVMATTVTFVEPDKNAACISDYMAASSANLEKVKKETAKLKPAVKISQLLSGAETVSGRATVVQNLDITCP